MPDANALREVDRRIRPRRTTQSRSVLPVMVLTAAFFVRYGGVQEKEIMNILIAMVSLGIVLLVAFRAGVWWRTAAKSKNTQLDPAFFS